MSTGLLVSVRSAAEARAAERGGADLIDIKEPNRGSLGMAEESVIAEIVECIAGRIPVSVALGELAEGKSPPEILPPGSYVKWGLSGLTHDRSRLDDLARLREQWSPTWNVVAVAYADWERADSPRPADLAGWAVEQGFRVFLIDTWGKDGSTLLDWVSEPELRALRTLLDEYQVKFAVAGSLGIKEMKSLVHLSPDWFAVRGAACVDCSRTSDIDEERVRTMTRWLHHGE